MVVSQALWGDMTLVNYKEIICERKREYMSFAKETPFYVLMVES